MATAPLRELDLRAGPPLPPGRLVELRGRAPVWVYEAAGPPGAPVLMLLHGLGAERGLELVSRIRHARRALPGHCSGSPRPRPHPTRRRAVHARRLCRRCIRSGGRARRGAFRRGRLLDGRTDRGAHVAESAPAHRRARARGHEPRLPGRHPRSTDVPITPVGACGHARSRLPVGTRACRRAPRPPIRVAVAPAVGGR